MNDKANRDVEVAENDPLPLVRYRKKDAERARQIDAMQDDVVSKIGEVIDSFKVKPERSQQMEEKLLKSRGSHLQPVQTPERRFDPSYIIMACLSVVLLMALVFYMFF